MSKVIVERPRRGSRLRNHKSALSLQPRLLDDDVYIYPPKPKHPKQKWLNEHLNPLRRYLESQVGRPWSKVYAEICQNLDSRKATGLHILQHLFDFVSVNTFLEGKTVMVWPEWGRARHALPVSGLYVHPVSGILRKTLEQKRAKRFPCPGPITELTLEAGIVYRKIADVWRRFEYGQRDPDGIAEIVRFYDDKPERNQQHGLRAPGDRKLIRYRDLPPGQSRYLLRSRQCTLPEIADIEERIRRARRA